MNNDDLLSELQRLQKENEFLTVIVVSLLKNLDLVQRAKRDLEIFLVGLRLKQNFDTFKARFCNYKK